MSNASTSLSNPILPLGNGLTVFLGTLNPPQQLALLSTAHTQLATAVAQKLEQSTVIAGPEDYRSLERLGLAQKRADNFHRLTPRGHYCAGILARQLADGLGIKFTARQTTRGAYQRKINIAQAIW